jgi:hypothetical protein
LISVFNYQIAPGESPDETYALKAPCSCPIHMGPVFIRECGISAVGS